jgi:hypothetical protein
MFRKKITLNVDSDATAILAKLRDECGAAGLSPKQADELTAIVSGPLETMIQSGRAVASSSGQFRASREINTDAAAIKLDACFGVPPGLLARLRRALTGR